jgi:hypothetical protein
MISTYEVAVVCIIRSGEVKGALIGDVSAGGSTRPALGDNEAAWTRRGVETGLRGAINDGFTGRSPR